MSPEITPVPTRTATIRPLVSLTLVWVFLIAVVVQNVQRATPAILFAPVSTFTPHKLSVYITADNQVNTIENGVIKQHIPLQVCANRDLVLETSDLAPIVTHELMDWVDTQTAYSFMVDRSFYINSSNMGIDIVFNDGEQVRLQVECPGLGANSHLAAVFISNDMVYLADMTNGTAAPLFWMDTHCELVWSEGTRLNRAFPWEMSIPLAIDGSPVPGNSVIAFTFTTEGMTQLNMTEANAVSVVSKSGIVTVYSDCGAPVLLPRPKQ